MNEANDLLIYEGPCKINCPEKCDVPEGAKVAWVPTPRHNWGDIIHCPNAGCEISLLVLEVNGEPA